MPFLAKPRMVTKMKKPKPKTAVTAIWLVGVNDPGIRPRKFAVRIKIKSVMISGKYLAPSWPATSSTIL